MSRLATCNACLFWNRAKRATWQDVGHGGKSYTIEHAQCRRYAPARFNPQVLGANIGSVWPHVNANDWCGEHQPVETITKQAAERGERR